MVHIAKRWGYPGPPLKANFMKNRNIARTLTAVLAAIAMQSVFAGWNHQSRRNCKIWAKYTASANAGYKAYDVMGSYVGSSGYTSHDTGCGYAHAGPLKYYGYNNFLLSEAESSIGSIGTVGYAHTWAQFDPVSNLQKNGTADGADTSRNSGRADTEKATDTSPTASNLIVIASTTFTDPVKAPSPAPPHVVLSGISGHLAAQAGYSTFEVIATLSRNQVPLETDKILWRGKAIVHDNRLTLLGRLTPTIFVPKAAGPAGKEIIYALNNAEIGIPLENGTNLDEVVVTTKGDTGNKSILTDSEYAAVAANRNPLPIVSGAAISVINTDKDGKVVAKAPGGK